LHSPHTQAEDMSPRNSRQSTASSRSRSSSCLSNPDVFSDDYALQPLDTRQASPFDAEDDPSPVSPISSLHTTASISRTISRESTAATSIQPPSASYKPLGHPNVASLLLNRSASSASNTFSDVHRASSTSSRFSMPRAQSPYTGATGPSHPYGMYPQITRASSIASASTVRPAERPFVAPSGPEHPYAMYSQNTVPEEDDMSLPPATIPVGFPGMGQRYQTGAETRREDIADIVGPDGHIEELPPYTQYADGIAPKETPSIIHVVSLPAATPQNAPTSPQSPQTHFVANELEMNSTSSKNTDSDSVGCFKEKIKQRSRRRVCCGLPFCFCFVIIGVLLIGVVLGAIIGGVIGRRKGDVTNGPPDANHIPSYVGTQYFDEAVFTDDGYSAPIATVTETSFLDGTPLPTDQPIPHVPNGPFNVATYGIETDSSNCILDPELHGAWACLPRIGMGITVIGQGWDANLTLDPYPLDKSSLRYGAQRPDIVSQPIKLAPSMDQDSSDLGPSLFAWTLYNKLTIGKLFFAYPTSFLTDIIFYSA
jgi:hypothetical protein